MYSVQERERISAGLVIFCAKKSNFDELAEANLHKLCLANFAGVFVKIS